MAEVYPHPRLPKRWKKKHTYRVWSDEEKLAWTPPKETECVYCGGRARLVDRGTYKCMEKGCGLHFPVLEPWLDDEAEMTRELVENLVDRFTPGDYLIEPPTPERLDEILWDPDIPEADAWPWHDYMLAILRCDMDRVKVLRHAITTASEGSERITRIMDEMEENPKGDLHNIPQTLFLIYTYRLRVEGWREKPEETPGQAHYRLISNYFREGMLWREETARLDVLLDVLWHVCLEALELGDKVTAWIADATSCYVSIYLSDWELSVPILRLPLAKVLSYRSEEGMEWYRREIGDIVEERIKAWLRTTGRI